MIEPEYIKLRNSLVISPNLGHPLFIGIDRKLNQKEFEIKLLFASNITDSANFEGFISENLKLIPILEYKWKLTKLLEKTKKKGIWSKIKSFFSRNKSKQITQVIEQLTDSKGDTFDVVQREKLEKLKPWAFRGDIIDCTVLEVQNVYECEIDNPAYDDYLSPQNYLLKHEIFGSLNKYFSATINFKLTDEVIEFLKSFNFVMFDILQLNLNKGDRINYHSIVISKNNWTNFKFLHATDLHLAERNDRIYEIVKKWQKSIRKSEVSEIVAQSVKALSFFQRMLMKKKQEEKAETTKPLKKRYINPNNNFKTFIKEANKSVSHNDLDFVVITGDIIDFSILSKINKEKRKTLDFDYEFSNWRIFKEILLNHPQKLRRGMVSGAELLCPIFTVPGNHDFRPYHYDLRWGNLYKKIGLNSTEAIALNNELLANPISSITKSFRALKAYLIEINSSLDFSLKLGGNNFVFLNSGSDSFKNIIDFVSGHPSVTGVTNKQIRFLENLINKTIKLGNNTFLMVHGPPINPKKTMSTLKRFSLSKPKDKIPSLEEFKESVMEKLGMRPFSIRIDDKFDLKFGTISSNWAKIINFCRNYCVLTLSGHTHQLKEFRLSDPQQKSINPNPTIPLKLEKLENPAAVFYDNYSERLRNKDEVEINAPYIVQTPALGLGSYAGSNLAGAYREIIIEKGKLTSFQVKYVNR